MRSKPSYTWNNFRNDWQKPFATMGIFISSSCPVGCKHCAVSAYPYENQTPPNKLIERVVHMCQESGLVAVAITGGEPFFEIDLLNTLVQILDDANKHVVVYTSGYWGKAEILPLIDQILKRIDGFVFGIDLYHRAYIHDEDLISALRCAAENDIWITAQVISGIGEDAHLKYAETIFQDAIGEDWGSQVTIIPTPPLPRGRASNLESFLEYIPNPDEFCRSINGPTLIRDGTLAACCNEEVVLKKGPESLRVRDKDDFQRALEELKKRTPLGYIRKLPPSILYSLAAEYLEVENRIQHRWMCEACWAFIDLFGQMDRLQQDKFNQMVNLLIESWTLQKEKSVKTQEPFTTSVQVTDV